MTSMDELSITDIHQMMNKNQITSVQLVNNYLSEIQSIDKSGPELNSVIEINPEALEIARHMDLEFKSKGFIGPLHGIPILVKDNIETGDKMMTTAGSLALLGNYAKEDAFIVKKLREAGAIILGKTNLSEWANFRGKRSISGWSSRGGQTKNPHDLKRNPCGSSSGSAVSVAANLCVAAIGTETDGSVVCPASANGIVGLKPSIGLISRNGIIPIAHSQDTAGPMCRNVRDVAILLNVLTGYDERDEITKNARQFRDLDYSQFLDKDGIAKSRIGVIRNYSNFNPKVMKIFEQNLNLLRENGATFVDPIEIKKPDGLDDAEYSVLIHEFKFDLNKYLSNINPNINIHTLSDLVKFNKDNQDKVLQFFDQEHFINANKVNIMKDEEYSKNSSLYNEFRKQLDNLLDQNQLDAFVIPTRDPAWLTDYINGDIGGGSSSSIAAITGYCNLTIPMGSVSGLPVGISFIGGNYQEGKILRLGYAFEQLIKSK